MKSTNLNTLTIIEAAIGLRAKEFSSMELTQACLTRAKERNTRLNAFITIDETKAIEQAKEKGKRADRLQESKSV